MQRGEGFRESLVVSGQAAESCRPSEASFDDPASWQQDEAAFCFCMLDHFKLYAMLGGRICSGCARISLIDIGQLDMLAGNLLHGLCQDSNLRAILFIGCSDVQRQQVSKRVNGCMNLRSLAPLGAVVARACTRLRRRSQRATIEDHRGWLCFAACVFAQKPAQILDHRLEATRINPAPHLLIDNLPRWQIVGQHAPVAAGLGHIAQRVEHCPQGILPLPRILATKRQIGRHERPFLIRHIRLIAKPISIAHITSSQIPPEYRYDAAYKGEKLITASRNKYYFYHGAGGFLPHGVDRHG